MKPVKLITAAATFGVLLCVPLVANAEPTPSPSPSLNPSQSSSPTSSPTIDEEVVRRAKTKSEALERAREIKAQADSLSEEYAKRTVEYSELEIKIDESNALIKELEESISNSEEAARKAQESINQAAASAYMNGGEFSEMMAGVFSGDPSDAITRLEYLDRVADSKAAQRQKSVGLVQKHNRDQARVNIQKTLLEKQREELDSKRNEIAGEIKRLTEMYEEAAALAEVLPEVIEVAGISGISPGLSLPSLSNSPINASGLSAWKTYVDQLKANGVTPVSRSIMNDQKRWPKDWQPVKAPSGGIQRGVAAIKDKFTGKPLVILPKETINGLEVGFKAIGYPYSWGGGTASGPSYGINWAGLDGSGVLGYDCSGLMVRIWGSQGLDIASRARVSQVQQVAYPRIANEDILPGDMIFWGSPAYHVAIYLGNGKMLESPTPGQHVTIANVRPFTSAVRATLG